MKLWDRSKIITVVTFATKCPIDFCYSFSVLHVVMSVCTQKEITSQTDKYLGSLSSKRMFLKTN